VLVECSLVERGEASPTTGHLSTHGLSHDINRFGVYGSGCIAFDGPFLNASALRFVEATSLTTNGFSFRCLVFVVKHVLIVRETTLACIARLLKQGDVIV